MTATFVGRMELDGRPIHAESFRHHAARAELLDGEVLISGHCALALRSTPGWGPLPQPLGSHNGEAILAADAIIDNRAELTHMLPAASDGGQASDQDLARAALARWGSDAGRHLIGDFALAEMYPAERRLTLVRDHIGARPLYYAQRGATVLFASSIAAIVACREFGWPIDDAMIAEYLQNPFFPVSGTFYQHVRKVPAGASVRIDPKKIEINRWWDPVPSADIRLPGPNDYVSACRALLDRAITDRIKGHAIIGAHLSGGIDSTGVTTLAQRALAERGMSLTAGYAWSPAMSDAWPDLGPGDERRRIATHALKEQIPLRLGQANGDTFLAFLDRRMDLEGDADLADELPVLQQAQRDGISILLSGWGGDEAFSAHGHGHLAHLLLSGQLRRARQFARARIGTLRNLRATAGLFYRDILLPLLPDMLSDALSKSIRLGRRSLIAPDLIGRCGNFPDRRIRVDADPSANLARLIAAGHITMRMESWASWSASHGILYRYPLTDRRLLEFLLAIPPEVLFLGERPRGLALATLKDALPPNISKFDAANEAFRARARLDAWRGLARRVREGFYDGDCPWLDMKAFRARALNPNEAGDTNAVLEFAGLYSAARVWTIHAAHSRIAGS